MPITKKERKRRYKILREAGFTSKEANMLKDLTPRKVHAMVDQRKKFEEDIKFIREGTKHDTQ